MARESRARPANILRRSNGGRFGVRELRVEVSQQHLDKPAVINGVNLLGESNSAWREGREGQHSCADIRKDLVDREAAIVATKVFESAEALSFAAGWSPIISRTTLIPGFSIRHD
jgi:hypothetical protein